MFDLCRKIERAQRRLEPKDEFDRSAELLLNDAEEYFAGTCSKADPRAWQHLLTYAPTSVLVKTIWWRCIKHFTYRWRN
jgi:hypothetical protein